MDTNDSFKAIADLNLDAIKVKLMHRESGEGWSLEKANAVEFEYRRFLILMKQFPQEETAPLMDVDTFWHYHILDTLKYAADCEQVFGYFLHHFPYIGLRGEDDEAAHHRVGERMKQLYEQTFGEDYLRAETAYSGRAVQAAFSSAAVQATAFSSAAVQATAYSGRAVQTAFSSAAYRQRRILAGPCRRRFPVLRCKRPRIRAAPPVLPRPHFPARPAKWPQRWSSHPRLVWKQGASIRIVRR